MKRLPVFLLTCAAALGVGAACAQSYPHKPISLIVPFPVSGPQEIFGTARASKLFALAASHSPPALTDVLARSVAQSLTALGQPVVLDRMPRGDGTYGTIAAARARPDGYTLLFGASTAMVINPRYAPKRSRELAQDFAPVAMVATMPYALLVHPSLPVQDLGELVAYARRRPGLINFASSGDRSTGHLAGELLNQLADIQLVHVAFNGGLNALSGVQTGQVQVGFVPLSLLLPNLADGKVNALGVTAARRFPAFPDLPTLSESGLPGFEAEAWYGVFAPAGTPRTAVETVNAALGQTLETPAMNALLIGYGVEPATGTPEQFAQRIRDDLAKWSGLLKGTVE